MAESLSNDEKFKSEEVTDEFMESLPLGNIKRRSTKRQESMLSNKRQELPKVEYTKVWSDCEKQTLLNMLYEFGDSDLEILASGLPNKHASQIKTYLRTVARRAYLAEKSRRKKVEIQHLEKWIKFLKDNFKEETLDDTVPFGLFILSRKYNQGFSNEIIDFQKAYEYLFALSIGRKTDVDEQTYYFVHSYLDWFLSQFNKNILPDGLALLTSALKKIKGATVDSSLTPNQVLHIIFHKVLPQEQYLSNKYFLRSICRKIRSVHFKKGDEYDRKISLLRAEVDEEPPLNNIYLIPPNCSIVPVCEQVSFKNLPSFVWAGLFNISADDLDQIAFMINRNVTGSNHTD